MATPSRAVYPAQPAPDADWLALLAPFAALGIDLEASARAYGALGRRRKVGSAADLLRLVLGYALEGWSLRDACAWAALVGLGDLSAVALSKRTRRAVGWLEHLVAALVTDNRLAGLGLPLRLRLLDATLGAKGRLRAHVGLDLGREAIDELELTDAKGGETLRRHAFASGDLAVCDAGHSHPAGLAHALGQGAHVIVRLAWQSLPLAPAPAGPPLGAEGLAALLAGCGPRAPLDLDVVVPRGADPPLGLRLVGCRLPAPEAEQRRRRLRRQARKKGRTPPRHSLRLADWLLLVTDLPRDEWLPEAILGLYRLRWQVELHFKRLKGVWLLDRIPPRCSAAAARALLLARLLAALLADRAARPCLPAVEAWAADVDRPLSRWAWQRLLRRCARDAVLGRLSFASLPAALPALRRHLCGPPGRRGHQAAAARDALNAYLTLLDRPAEPLTHAA